MTTAIIADDERNLAEHLQRQLSSVWPTLTIHGIANNGPEALSLIQQHQPDIAFLDIRMPGMTGLDVARQLPARTRVVFVTAFDQYAIDAFDTAAADYLLKPVSEERLRTCVSRLVEPRRSQTVDLTTLLDQLASRQPLPAPQRLRWLRVGHADTTRLIDVDDVLYFQSDSKYTTVVTEQREDVVRMTIKELEDGLDPEQFWRVHRGVIVNARAVVEARKDLRGRFVLKIRGRSEPLRTSEAYAHLFRHM
jgi:DNA-binding LytR/AlgR family response regulator